MVEPLEPYSERLAHGTLLLTHGPIVRHRFATIRRGIMLDTLGFLLGGVCAATAGLFAGITEVTLTGAGAIFLSGIHWCVRTAIMNRRQRATPSIIFVSDDGISGIMPDNHSITIAWHGLTAHETHFTPSILSSNTTASDRMAWRGLLLKGDGKERIHVMHDLDGLDDLLCVLADLSVPVFSHYQRIRNLGDGPRNEMVRG